MLTFKFYENSLNDRAISINLKRYLGMILGYDETQATTKERLKL